MPYPNIVNKEHYREVLVPPLPLSPAAGAWRDTQGLCDTHHCRHDKNIHYQLQLLRVASIMNQPTWVTLTFLKLEYACETI